MNSSRINTAFAILAVAAGLAAGCSSSNNNNGPTTTPTNGGNSVTGGSANGGSSENGGSAIMSMGGASNAGASSGGASSGGSSSTSVTGTGGGTCVPDTSKTCYSCPPSTNDQFLNACTGAACQKFDNTAKGVPSPLPAIP